MLPSFGRLLAPFCVATVIGLGCTAVEPDDEAAAASDSGEASQSSSTSSSSTTGAVTTKSASTTGGTSNGSSGHGTGGSDSGSGSSTTGASESSGDAPVGCTEKRERSLAILEEHCAACHGNGADQGGFSSVLDLDVMIIEGRIIPGRPEESIVWTVIADGLQPPAPADPVPAEDTQLLYDWIANCIAE